MGKRKIILIFLFFLSLLFSGCSTPTAPEPTFTIKGKVYIELFPDDVFGEGASSVTTFTEVYLVGAPVELQIQGKKLASSITSEEGEFLFKEVSSGEYSLYSSVKIHSFKYEDRQEVVVEEDVVKDLLLKKTGLVVGSRD